MGQNSSLRVLVVDDNADACESQAMLLRLSGHQTAVAHDGPSALNAFREFAPDVVLLDIGLPGMSGWDLAPRLRERAGGRPFLLVAVTGHASVQDEERSR